MDTNARVQMVNKLLGEKSFFKHFEENEIVSWVSIDMHVDHVEYTHRYTRDTLPCSGSQRVDIVDDETRSLIYATNAILHQR
jgi:hypothetical protein